MRNTFINEIAKNAKENKNIIMMCGDLGYNVLNEFYDDMKEQYINAGISEQNMMSMASALGLDGKKVYTYSIGNFNTLRCLEQLRNDCLYHKSNVVVVSVGAGFTYANLGMSHHATEEEAILRCLPGITIFTPSDKNEALSIAKLTIDMNTPCYVRLGKGKEEDIHEKSVTVKIGKPIKVIDGINIAIIANGPGAIECKNAVKYLNDNNMSAAFYTLPTIKPLDKKEFDKIFSSYDMIITFEENNITGSLFGALSEIHSLKHYDSFLYPIGLKDEYTSVVGNEKYLRDYYKINEKEIIKTVKKYYERKGK